MPAETGLHFEVPGPALVTGAAQGIGYEIANHLMSAGSDVLIYDRNRDGAEQAATALGKAHPGRSAVWFEGDVADEGAMHAAFDMAAEEIGIPRVLVNNALYQSVDLIVRLTTPEWRRVFEVIVEGTFIGTREFGRRYMEQGLTGGAIVNVSTLNYHVPAAGLAAYCSAKAAVSQFTSVAALEYAALGVRVNAIAPGLTDTPLARPFFENHQEVTDAFLRNTPLGRVGTPADQARAACFLASEAAGWITGVTLVVDGGLHLLGVPDNWPLFKAPLGLTDPTPADWGASDMGAELRMDGGAR